MPFQLINCTVKLNAKISNMQTEPCNFSSRTLCLVMSKNKSILGLMALYKALYKMWLGVLEWNIGVRESIVEA